MSCSGCATKARVEARTVWTNKSTTAHFLPYFTVALAKVSRAKIDLLVEGIDSAISLTRGVRYSNDSGVTWSAVTEIGSPVTAEGWDHDTAYNLLDDDYDTAQLGLQVKNASGTDLHMARTTVQLVTAASER